MSSFVISSASPETVACHECDCINRLPQLESSGTVRCRRCGAALFRNIPDSVERSLILSIAALILFILSVSFPLLIFRLQGQEQHATLITGVETLYQQGFWELALLVFVCSIAVPLLRILVALYLFTPLYFGYTPRGFTRLLPLFITLTPWAMTEVFLLGVIVAYVKLIDLATIVIGISSWTFIGMILISSWAATCIDSRRLWQFADAVPVPDLVPTSPRSRISCHSCSLILPQDEPENAHGKCPRCNSALHYRKPDSINRTWALLVASLICYIPANLLPIMTVISFGEGEPDTIISGVKALIAAEMYPIAALVFIASIFVPMLKIGILAYLLVSVQMRSQWRLRERTMLYRITEAIGRWSMLDIFMISILAGLVKLGAIATIAPNLGAVFFAAVVILTMIAATAFDPRLIWDVADERDR